tara:strand:- start:773 stop:1201 length:429 start_codon:yes stop_codon:yes gene_type:complete
MTKSSYIEIGIAIVIDDNGLVLIDQRLEKGDFGGLWEFPGGKRKKGETFQETIIRELEEELSIIVNVHDLIVDMEHDYADKKFRFVVHICKLFTGSPKAIQSQQFKWVEPSNLKFYSFPAASNKIINSFLNYLKMNQKKKIV